MTLRLASLSTDLWKGWGQPCFKRPPVLSLFRNNLRFVEKSHRQQQASVLPSPAFLAPAS